MIRFPCAPEKSLLVSSRYMFKPSAISLPTCANGPVTGAINPIRSSSAATDGDAIPSTKQPPNSSRDEVCVMTLLPFWRYQPDAEIDGAAGSWRLGPGQAHLKTEPLPGSLVTELTGARIGSVAFTRESANAEIAP